MTGSNLTEPQERWLSALEAGRYADLSRTGWARSPVDFWQQKDEERAYSALGVAMAELNAEDRGMAEHRVRWRPAYWDKSGETPMVESHGLALPASTCDALRVRRGVRPFGLGLLLRGRLLFHPDAPPLFGARSVLMANYNGADHSAIAAYLRALPWAVFETSAKPAEFDPVAAMCENPALFARPESEETRP